MKIDFITTIIVTIIILSLMIGIPLLDFKAYNSGVCNKCGGNYEIINEYILGGSSYVDLECASCGHKLPYISKSYLH